jgi:hypothetical protein
MQDVVYLQHIALVTGPTDFTEDGRRVDGSAQMFAF